MRHEVTKKCIVFRENADILMQKTRSFFGIQLAVTESSVVYTASKPIITKMIGSLLLHGELFRQ